MKVLRVLVLAVSVCCAGTAQSAGLFGPACRFVDDAGELLDYTDVALLRDEVARRYEHALDVSLQRSTIYSTSPLFTWANEAKISCAKALGYLKRRLWWRPVVEEETIQQCECFYARMREYGG